MEIKKQPTEYITDSISDDGWWTIQVVARCSNNVPINEHDRAKIKMVLDNACSHINKLLFTAKTDWD